MSRNIATFFAVSLFATNLFGATLNEIRISAPGDDDDVNNFVEIAGMAGESLDNLTLVSMSIEFEPGEISFAIPLTGETIPADGFLLASGDDMFYGDATDINTGIDYFGSPQIFALLQDFTGAQGDDLDADNDGALDSAPWAAIIDAVALLDGDGDMDFVYDPEIPTVGPDGNFPPAHAFRATDGDGAWNAGQFSDFSADTPGASNIIPEPSSALLALLGIVGLMARRRR